MALHRTQVVIVGGGMIGLSLAIALRQQKKNVVLIERRAKTADIPEQLQLRVSAISEGSRNWLQALGVWSQLPADRLGPYQGMEVWDKDSSGRISFSAEEAQLQNLGHIVENAVLEAVLWQQAETLGVQLISEVEHEAPELSAQDVSLSLSNGDIVLAQLLVAADGAQSKLREQAGTPVTFKDYEQQGLVATIRTAQPHNGIARQAFMPGGPLALLPMADPHLCSIVWSLPTLKAQSYAEESEADFVKRLAVASDSILGIPELVSERQNFPLRMRYAERWVSGRQVLVGDAAHTIHPLAGQGANLGLGDVETLANMLGQLGTLNGVWDDVELKRCLQGFQRARKAAAVQQIATMEAFHQLFRTANPVLKLMRGIGLKTVNAQPLLKRFFMQQASR
ncbi:hypothetical protein CWE09_11290 [Aliidiomarina minuta]|uniref:FAD-binding domain-containing protein n=1 Tax=Aliidiomarina minuta TaxID=880057 RepID=A0A432W4P9_9GAMM|nr:FAD-dependent oxidoreductase [Aliidiomarina minuta]RUO24439.1 hypothetical protein CWE09_11290 [Aliidiomarina minuta]